MGLRASWAARSLATYCVWGVLYAACAVPVHASALDDTAVLVRLLRDSRSFRVRARAAIALARVGHAEDLTALEGALVDRHPAVRMAAATALGEVGARRSVSALRGATSDASPGVAEHAKLALRMIATREMSVLPFDSVATNPPPTTALTSVASGREPPADARSLDGVRYAVVLGDMRQRAGVSGRDLSLLLRTLIAAELRKVDHVAVFSVDELTRQRAEDFAHQQVSVVRLEANLNRIDSPPSASEFTTRCEVSLVLLDEHARTLRVALKGAATGNEQQPAGTAAQRLALAHRTLKGAVASATADLRQALEATRSEYTAAEGRIGGEAALARRSPRVGARYARP